jgi:hypothetical protein
LGEGFAQRIDRTIAPDTTAHTAEDPIGFRGGINKYAYVDDSPLNFVDPFGKDKHNPCRHLLVDSISLATDAVGLIPGAYPLSSLAKPLAKSVLGIGVGSAGTMISAMDQDLPGSMMGIAGVQLSALELAGLGSVIGDALAAYSTVRDVIRTTKDIWDCSNVCVRAITG